MTDEQASDPEESSYRMDTWIRHQNAIAASDVQWLRECLLSAARLFDDIAKELDENPKYQPQDFMRASAKRFRIESGLKRLA